jgi:YgiT-type zinc finger domain-containing protein
MTCFFCKGNMKTDTAKHYVDLNSCDVIIRGVPCHRCTQCGEVAFEYNVAERLEQIVGTLRGSISEIAVVQYSENIAA